MSSEEKSECAAKGCKWIGTSDQKVKVPIEYGYQLCCPQCQGESFYVVSDPQRPTAYLEWSLTIECPKCKKDNDLSDGDHDADGCYATPIFNNDWDELTDQTVSCEHCEHEFMIGDTTC